jgi:hypothetical protein
MKPVAKMSLGELAAFVCTQLRKRDIKAVLSGDACVTIYTDNRYESHDLDFVENAPTERKRMAEALVEIGFVEKDRCFKHPDTDFIVEFPAGPLAVGSEPVGQIEEREYSTGRLSLLSPTDCVKDRLVAYYHWSDPQCLEQALLVAEAERVHLKEIQRWSAAENKAAEFERIRKRLSGAARKKGMTPGLQEVAGSSPAAPTRQLFEQSFVSRSSAPIALDTRPERD